MIESQVQIRVRYSETDQMGYVYYGNFAAYFEVARVECFRNIGFSYKELEQSGILMPVAEYKIKYSRPAKYDDVLTIKVLIKEKPTIKIVFEYEVYNEENLLIATSETKLAFINAATNRPCLLQAPFNQLLEKYF